MTNIEAFQNPTWKLLIHPLLWRFMGFGSSIVGFTCFALSPTFQDLFGQWTLPKMIMYSVGSSVLSILMLFIKRCSWGFVRSFLLRAQVGFLVLTLTSLCSLMEDRGEEGKVENRYGKMMKLTSTGAFAMMAMSLSRQLQLGFEVGVFNFLVGSFLVTVMKMNLKLAPLAALLCCMLVNIRSISDFLLQIRALRGDTQQHADDDKNTVTLYRRTNSWEDFEACAEDYHSNSDVFLYYTDDISFEDCN